MNEVDQALERIAQQELRIETLETRKSDSLNFHDVSVWSLKEALMRAYELGREDARKEAKR